MDSMAVSVPQPKRAVNSSVLDSLNDSTFASGTFQLFGANANAQRSGSYNSLISQNTTPEPVDSLLYSSFSSTSLEKVGAQWAGSAPPGLAGQPQPHGSNDNRILATNGVSPSLGTLPATARGAESGGLAGLGIGSVSATNIVGFAQHPGAITRERSWSEGYDSVGLDLDGLLMADVHARGVVGIGLGRPASTPVDSRPALGGLAAGFSHSMHALGHAGQASLLDASLYSDPGLLHKSQSASSFSYNASQGFHQQHQQQQQLHSLAGSGSSMMRPMAPGGVPPYGKQASWPGIPRPLSASASASASHSHSNLASMAPLSSAPMHAVSPGSSPHEAVNELWRGNGGHSPGSFRPPSAPSSSPGTSHSSHSHSVFEPSRGSSPPFRQGSPKGITAQGLGSAAAHEDIEEAVIRNCHAILEDAASHSLKAVELANTLRARIGTEILADVRERCGGLLALLERQPDVFIVRRIPKNDFVCLTNSDEGAAMRSVEMAASFEGGADDSLSQGSEGQASRCLHVGNVPANLTEAQLYVEFERFGELEGLKVVTQRSRRFAFVTFATIEQAVAAKQRIAKLTPWKSAISFAHKESIAGGGGQGMGPGAASGGGPRDSPRHQQHQQGQYSSHSSHPHSHSQGQGQGQGQWGLQGGMGGSIGSAMSGRAYAPPAQFDDYSPQPRFEDPHQQQLYQQQQQQHQQHQAPPPPQYSPRPGTTCPAMQRLCDDTYTPSCPWPVDHVTDMPFVSACVAQLQQFGGSTSVSKLRGFLRNRIAASDNVKSVPLKALLAAYPYLFDLRGNHVALVQHAQQQPAPLAMYPIQQQQYHQHQQHQPYYY